MGASASVASGVAPVLAKGKGAPPNILFIMADDMGYADLGCFGSRHIRTPMLDRMAEQGVRLTDCYANSPVCSPTRLALITGCYHTRFRTGLVEPFSAGEWGEKAIPDGRPTLPGELRKAGYTTALIGKWHLGDTPAGSPLKHGYDRFFGYLGGGIDYFTHEYMKKPALREGDGEAARHGYLTTLLADETTKFMRDAAARRQPFAISLHFNAPHWPWEGPEDSNLGTQGNHYDGGSLATYAQMMESLDRNTGRVLAELDNLALSSNTIVVFTSDNGGERFSETWPFRGAKGFLLEGGIRVPGIVRYPAAFGAGRTSSQPAISMDWMATFLDVAGVPQRDWPEMDGISLVNSLAQGPTKARDLFWKFQGHRQRAMRRENWKYYRLGEHEFLYDIGADTMERANRAKAHPDALKALSTAWEGWNKDMANDEGILGYCDDPAKVGIPYRVGTEAKCKAPRGE